MVKMASTIKWMPFFKSGCTNSYYANT